MLALLANLRRNKKKARFELGRRNTFNLIKDAIFKKKVISFCYVSGNGDD